MILTLGTVFFLDVTQNLKILTTLMIIHNIFAATQDIAIDAMAVQVLPENERGIANGFMFGAQRLGVTLGGSVSILIIGAFGFNTALLFILISLILILVMVTSRIHESVEMKDAKDNQTALLEYVWIRVKTYIRELYQGFFSSGIGPKVGTAFSLLPSGALVLGLALSSTMQVDIGMNENEIARFTMFTTILGALGCIIGGWISDRIGHRKALGLWYILTMIPTFYLASQFFGINSMQGVTIREFTIAMFCYSLTAGLVIGTSTAVFMGLTNPMVAGTQFTGYMALCNLVYSYSNLWQGRFAEVYGYSKTLNLDGILAVIPLILIPFLKPSERSRY
jgi:PAT family beta-lactamase induction signal transducer AmpG